MRRRPPSTTLTYTLLPYTTHFRSSSAAALRLSRRRAISATLDPRWASPTPMQRPSPLDAPTTTVLMFRSPCVPMTARSEEHTSELQLLMRISYAVFCLKQKPPIPFYNTDITITLFSFLPTHY